MARVEFYAVAESVISLLEQGHTYISEYELLIKKGKISMCYGAFCNHAKASRARKKKETSAKTASTPIASAVPATASGPRVVKGAASAFDPQNQLDVQELMKVEE